MIQISATVSVIFSEQASLKGRTSLSGASYVPGLKDRLTAHFSFNESSGNFFDGIQGLELNRNNAGYSASGKFGGCVEMDADGEYCYDVGLAQKELWQRNSSGITISAWVTFSTLPSTLSQSDQIMYATLDNGGYIMLYVYWGVDKMRIYYNDPDSNTRSVYEINAITQLNTWHHYVFVVTLDDLYIYRDGSDVTDGSGNSGAIQNSGISLSVSDNDATGHLGKIDQLAIWTRALTPQEVADLHNSGGGVPFEEWYAPNSGILKGKGRLTGTCSVTFSEQAALKGTGRLRGYSRGVEELANNTLDTDTDWSKGPNTTISGGEAHLDYSSSEVDALVQTVTDSNDRYKYFWTSFEVTDYTTGSCCFRVGSSGNRLAGQADGVGVWERIQDTIDYIPEYGSGIYIGGSGFIGSIDNVYMKEVTWTCVMTFGTTTANLVDSAAVGTMSASTTVSFSEQATLKGVTELTVTETLTFSEQASLKGRSTLSGTCNVVFSEQADLIGEGGVSSTSTITFSEQAVLKGVGTLSGTSSVTFSEQANISGGVGMSASTTVTFSEQATLKGTTSLSATAVITFSEQAVLTGEGGMSGAASIVFSEQANIRGRVQISAATIMTFSEQAVWTSTNKITSIGTIVFSEQASIWDATSNQVSATETVTFTEQAVLKGRAQIATSTTITFSEQAVLKGTTSISASTTATFSEQAVLKATGVLAASVTITFSEQANVKDAVSDQMSGTCDVVFTEQATLTATVKITASTTMTFSEQGVMVSTTKVNILGTTSVAFTEQARLVARIQLTASETITFGEQAVGKLRIPAKAQDTMTFTTQAVSIGRGRLRTSETIEFTLIGALGGTAMTQGQVVLEFTLSEAHLYNSSDVVFEAVNYSTPINTIISYICPVNTEIEYTAEVNTEVEYTTEII